MSPKINSARTPKVVVAYHDWWFQLVTYGFQMNIDSLPGDRNAKK